MGGGGFVRAQIATAKWHHRWGRTHPLSCICTGMLLALRQRFRLDEKRISMVFSLWLGLFIWGDFKIMTTSSRRMLLFKRGGIVRSNFASPLPCDSIKN